MPLNTGKKYNNLLKQVLDIKRNICFWNQCYIDDGIAKVLLDIINVLELQNKMLRQKSSKHLRRYNATKN
jgi:hypothetical protein